MATSDNVYININKRIFYISDDIDNSSIGKICHNLIYLLDEDEKNFEEKKKYKREPIKIYINSYGGDIYDMWALIDLIQSSATPIYTYCTGYAMSAAFLIFLAGHKRYASKHTTFMLHQLSAYREGVYQQIMEDMTELDTLNSMSEQYIIERTKITQEQIDDIRNKKKDWYIHTSEALKLGIINDYITSL